MARTQLDTIIDELVTLEQGITGAEISYADVPEGVAAAPCWLNMPLRGRMTSPTKDKSEDVHTIVCACVKRRALSPADDALMKPFITKFMDELDGSQSLSGNVEFIVEVRYEYGLIETLSSPDDLMFGVYFEVDVMVKDDIAVSL